MAQWGISGPVYQSVYNGSISSIHLGTWGISLPLVEHHIAHGTYNSSQHRQFSLHLSSASVQSTMICTSHPYAFVASSNISIIKCNHSFCVNVSQPLYASCLTYNNITTLSLTYIMPIRRCSEVWLPMNLTREWEGEGSLQQLK